MPVLSDIIKKYEKLYKKNNDSVSALAVIARYYTCFVESSDSDYIRKAYYTAFERFIDNPRNIVFLVLTVFFDAQAGRFDDALAKLAVADGYKGYLKTHMPEIYGIYLYLYALIYFKKRRTRESVRSYRSLNEYAQSRSLNALIIFLADLDIAYDNFNSAKKRLESAVDNGNGSCYLYICLYKYFKSKNKSIYCTEKLFIPFIRWGIAHGINLNVIVNLYTDKICSYFEKNSSIGFKIYSIYQDERLLKEICFFLMKKNDFSLNAYFYYNEAVRKQIHIHGIIAFYIRSSFYGEKEDFGIYPLKTFLIYEKIDDDLKPYIYHLVLSNKKFRGLLEYCYDDILKFGFYALENKSEGRYYNSIYKFILENESNELVTQYYIEEAEKALCGQLFLYEIETENLNAFYCCISEKYKSRGEVYALEDGKAEIKALSDKFSYYLTDGGKKNIVGGKIKMKRAIENADFKMYKRFYNKGYRSEELIAMLANYYADMEYPNSECVELFEEVLNKVDISYEFRMKLLTAVGNIYYYRGDYKKALRYYALIDEKYIKDKYAENVFEVFILNGDIEKAVRLMNYKRYCISDKVLANGIRKAIKYENVRPYLADCAYELILKTGYDRNLVELVTEYYKGGRRDWQILSKALHEAGMPDINIDEKVIKTGMTTRVFDEGIQEVFGFIYENDRKNSLIHDFVEYCCYEILVNHVCPQISMIKILEEIFFETDDEILSYALCHVYLEHEAVTDNLQVIIIRAVEKMKKRNLLFPVLKKALGNISSDLYIEKNYPFIYNASSGKNILFYFREKGDVDFYVQPMKYLTFGIYYICIPIFYEEEIEYYMCEYMENGSVETKKRIAVNDNMSLHENTDDLFFEINNAVIYEKLFKHENAETIINGKLKKADNIRGSLL